MTAQIAKNRPKPINITPAQKSFGLLIFIGDLLQRRAKCNMRSLFHSYLQAMSAGRFLVFALALALAACGERAKLDRLPSEAVVLAFGDSLTFGTGATEAGSYPAQLEQLIGRRVGRARVPGEVAAPAPRRLARAPDAQCPGPLLRGIGGHGFLR